MKTFLDFLLICIFVYGFIPLCFFFNVPYFLLFYVICVFVTFLIEFAITVTGIQFKNAYMYIFICQGIKYIPFSLIMYPIFVLYYFYINKEYLVREYSYVTYYGNYRKQKIIGHINIFFVMLLWPTDLVASGNYQTVEICSSGNPFYGKYSSKYLQRTSLFQFSIVSLQCKFYR